jgi:hypothetical protein
LAALAAPCLDQTLKCELSQLSDRETLTQEDWFSAPVPMARQYAERAPLLVGQRRHCAPVRLSRGGRSLQRGRASAPMMPQPVQTMRGPKVGTGTLSGQRSAFRIAWWWQSQHDTSSDRTPSSRMLPSVIGSIGWSKRGM